MNKLKKFQQFNEDMGNMDMHSMGMEHMDIEHDMDRDNTSNYMFFENLKTIQRLIEELLTLDETEVDEIIESGHDWATDHISVAKTDIEQVYNFLMNNAEEGEYDHDSDMEHTMDMEQDMYNDMGIDMEEEPENFSSFSEEEGENEDEEDEEDEENYDGE